MMLEPFIAKIGIAILKAAVAKVAFSSLLNIFRINSSFNRHSETSVLAINDASDLGLFGLEVASGILSDHAIDSLSRLGRSSFDIEKRGNGLLIARNRLITDPIELSAPPGVIESAGPISYDFYVKYNSIYDSIYNTAYQNHYRSAYVSRLY